jgi:hypothetical protein
MSGPYITQGTRVRARWLHADDPTGCLSGVQLKHTVKSYEVIGICRHFRGDHPMNPTRVMVYIDPDAGWQGPTVRPEGCTCSHEHVAVNPDHIIQVISPPSPPDCNIKMSFYGTCPNGTRGCISRHGKPRSV